MQKKPNDTEPPALEAKKGRRARKFTPEFKAGAVRLVTEGGRTFAGAAAALGVAKSSILRWSQEAKATWPVTVMCTVLRVSRVD